MKPITNILIVLALICYVFLPLYSVSFHGSVTGFEFTAGHISQSFLSGATLFALLPFITCFAAIAFNSLKNRWWTLASIVCLLVCIGFFVETMGFDEIMLQHDPDLKPDKDLGEGFKVIGLGLGHKSAFGLTILSLVSAIISLLPFKFNQTLERAVDETIEDGRRHVKEEWNRLETRHRSRHDKPAATQQPTAAESEKVATPPPFVDKEDNSRFMPPTAGEDEPAEATPPPIPIDREDDSRFMPPQ